MIEGTKIELGKVGHYLGGLKEVTLGSSIVMIKSKKCGFAIYYLSPIVFRSLVETLHNLTCRGFEGSPAPLSQKLELTHPRTATPLPL